MKFNLFFKSAFIGAFVVAQPVYAAQVVTAQRTYDCVLNHSNDTLSYVNNIKVTVAEDSAEYKLYDGFGNIIAEDYFTLLGYVDQSSYKMDLFSDKGQLNRLFVYNSFNDESNIALNITILTSATTAINFVGNFNRCQ